MSTRIGSTITGFGRAVQVGSFTGPGGAKAVQIDFLGGVVSYAQFKEEEARKLIQLLEAALRDEPIGDL